MILKEFSPKDSFEEARDGRWSHDGPAEWLSKQLEQASPDLLREMLATFAAQLMGPEVDGICGAEYGARSPDRVNSRNGYRPREWDTRAGTIELAIPKLAMSEQLHMAHPLPINGHRRRHREARPQVPGWVGGSSRRRARHPEDRSGGRLRSRLSRRCCTGMLCRSPAVQGSSCPRCCCVHEKRLPGSC